MHFEYRLDRVIAIVRVAHLHVDEAALIGADKVNLARLDPIGRLNGNSYCRVTDVFDLPGRPRRSKIRLRLGKLQNKQH